MTVDEFEKLKFNDIDDSILEKLPNFEDGSELAEMLKYSNKLGWNDAIDTIINKLTMENYDKGYMPLTCFDCQFAAACEDNSYVFCTKRNMKFAVHEAPCLQYYTPRYTHS